MKSNVCGGREVKKQNKTTGRIGELTLGTIRVLANLVC